MVVMCGTSDPVCKQFSHQKRQHLKAPEFHHILMQCCIYEIRMLSVPVCNEMCVGVICLCAESVRIVSCVGIDLCL